MEQELTQQQQEIDIPITLTAGEHALIVRFIPDRGEWRASRYIDQLFPNAREEFPNQDITVNVKPSLIIGIYDEMGRKDARLVAEDNERVREKLLPQLQALGAWDVLQQLGAITVANGNETEQLRREGFEYLKQIREG
jgi:hypothetical protein